MKKSQPICCIMILLFIYFDLHIKIQKTFTFEHFGYNEYLFNYAALDVDKLKRMFGL